MLLRAGAIFSATSEPTSSNEPPSSNGPSSSNEPSSLSSAEEFEKSTSTGLFGWSDFFSRTGLMAVG